MSRCEYLLHIGETTNALAAMDSSLHGIPNGLRSLIACTEASLAAGDTTRSTGYLEQIFAAGGQSMLTYSDPIKGLLASGLTEPVSGRLQRAMGIWTVKADSVWIDALMEMKELDQSHRAFDAHTRHNDSLNLERLILLTEQRGFPSPDKVGTSYWIVSLLLFHHQGELGMNSRLLHFLDLAHVAMEECRIEPSFDAWLIDLEAEASGKATPYGTLIGYHRNDLERLHLPELLTLNANRASVGLGPIDEFAAILGVPFGDLPIGR
jgi:hypothetical protein